MEFSGTLKRFFRYNRTGSLVLMVTVVLLFVQCKNDETNHYSEFQNPLQNTTDGPPAGNPDGNYPIPLDAAIEDVSQPTHVIGKGTPESVTEEAFITAVAQGGVITFNGGSKPFTLTLTKPAKVYGNIPAVIFLNKPTLAGLTSLRPVPIIKGQLRVTLLAPAATAKVPVCRTVPAEFVNCIKTFPAVVFFTATETRLHEARQSNVIV